MIASSANNNGYAENVLRQFLLIAVIAILLLMLFNYFAPLEPGSLAVWTGLVLCPAGALSVLKPLRFLVIRSRRVGLLVLAAGLALACAGLYWPARTVHAVGHASYLDAVLPDYQFVERHEVRVHAAADRVATAMQETTFGDIRGFETLMSIRRLAGGNLRRGGPSPAQRRVLETFSTPQSGFLPLYQDSREIVMGMVGQPWVNGRPPLLHDPADFAAFHAPASVRIAFNLLIVDDGNGWSRLITETRVQGTDAAGTRTMARYWRVIYPGSGMIRRMWLNAIRDRAKAPVIIRSQAPC